MEKRWRVISTKSDAEPWWFFDGWEKDIMKEWTFKNKNEAVEKYIKEIQYFHEKYPHKKMKKYHSIAFWDKREVIFCEACDDDLQVYHGLILFEDDKPMVITDDSKTAYKINKSVNN